MTMRGAKMTTKLKARLDRLERDLPARRRLAADAGLSDFDAEEYNRLFDKLLGTMPSAHRLAVLDELTLKERRARALRLAGREDRFRLRPPRRPLAPRVRLSRLTLSFIGRLERALRGDRRPLALPRKVCDVYLWAEQFKRDDIPVRECEACGYDTPAPPRVTHMSVLNVMSGTSHLIEAHSPFAVISCPLCGDTLAPPGERPWSDRNPDEVVDVHVWADGEISTVS
jgi:hypothetical protein